MADMQMVRPAGLNERRCIARDVLGLYGSIVTLGTYIASDFQGQLSKDIIYKALKHCIAQHAALSIVVQDADSEKPQLARATRIDLGKHVRLLDESTSKDYLAGVKDVLETAHNQALDEYEIRPQWRLYVAPLSSNGSNQAARHYQVAFATSHALADGMSGIAFHKTFFQALNEASDPDLKCDAILDLGSVDQAGLPPPQELAGTFTISWAFLLGPLLREYCPTWLARTLGVSQDLTDSGGAAHAWSGAISRPKIPANGKELIDTTVHLAPVPHDVLQRALNACRQRDAKLTGLLNHLFARALAATLQSKDQNFTRFIAETAIDLRRCLAAGKDKMANYVSADEEIIDVNPDTIANTRALSDEDWTAISNTSKKLAQASSTLTDQPVALLKYLSNFRDWTFKNAQEPAKASFGMSNLGTFCTPNGGTQVWKVENMIFSQSANGTGTPFDVNVASAEDGDLNLVISWCPGMLGMDGVQDERSFVESFCNDVVQQLESL